MTIIKFDNCFKYKIAELIKRAKYKIIFIFMN